MQDLGETLPGTHASIATEVLQQHANFWVGQDSRLLLTASRGLSLLTGGLQGGILLQGFVQGIA